MEFDDQNAVFNDIQFIADYLNADFQNEDTYNKFMQTITNNVGHFARLTRTDSENFFSQFHDDVVKSIHTSLAETVLVHHDLKSQFICKDNPKKDGIFKEIFEFCQILMANQNMIQSYDFSKLFTKVAKQKNANILLEENLKILIDEVKNLKLVINSQTKSIDRISSENKFLKDELIKITKMVESNKASSAFSIPFPPLISNNTSSVNPSSSGHHTPIRGGPSFAQSILNNPTKVQASASSQGTKRILQHQNQNPNKVAKPTPKTQKELKSFDSFNPDSRNKVIDLSKDDGFKQVGKKFNKNSKKKTEYAKVIGRDVSNLLVAKSKQFYIYLGQLDMQVEIDSVKKYLDSKLKDVKFDDCSTRDVKYDNLKELNTDKENRTFKSFSFSVGYIIKDIIDNKSLWPLYSIVNKFKMSHAEWTKISEKFNKKPIVTTPISNE